MKNWKACERKIAELVAGAEVLVSGRQRGITPDVEHQTVEQHTGGV